MIITLDKNCPKELISQFKNFFPYPTIKMGNEYNITQEKSDNFTDILDNTTIIKSNLLDKDILFKDKKDFKCKIGSQQISNNITSIILEFTSKNKKNDLSLMYYIGLNGIMLIITENNYWNLKYIVNLKELQIGNRISHYTNTDIIYFMIYTEEIIEMLIDEGYDAKDINLFKMFNADPEHIKALLMIKEFMMI